MKLILSAKTWLYFGLFLILTGFIIGHLCNANINNWACENEHLAGLIFHGGGSAIVLVGIIIYISPSKHH